MQWDNCNSGQLTLDGLMRVDVNDLVPLADGREIALTVTTVGFHVTTTTPGALPITLNFVLPIRYTRTTTSDRYVLAAATYRSGASIGEDSLEMLSVDLLQDYATNTYRYSLSGSVDSAFLDGQFNFETTEAFTGAGRISLRANWWPRAAGTRAPDSLKKAARSPIQTPFSRRWTPTVMASTTWSCRISEWSTVFPLVMFTSFRDQ
jgi:hypothetical protein